jgi:hypothetical protein
MANEITISLKMSVLKGSLAHIENPGSISVTLTTGTAIGGVPAITTSAALLAMGSVTSPGYAFFRNTDLTNFVEIGTGTGTFVPFLKLKAGEASLMRLSTAAPSARANTASVNLQYFILSD